MVTHIQRDDLLVLNQQFQRDAIRQVDGHRTHTLKSPRQSMQAKRRVVRVDFQQSQGLGLLVFQLGGRFKKRRARRV